MSERQVHSRVRPAIAPLVIVGALLLTSCGGAGDEPVAAAAAPATSDATTTVAPTTTTTAAPTTTTTIAPTTTTAVPATTTTTVAPTTTTTVALPAQPATQPIAPPTDEYAKEPVIELGRIAIPKIGVDMAMYEGIRLSTLDYGPGHWPGTAMPGQLGNVVVGGHRVSKHKVFRNVDQLAAGDEIIFTDANGEHRYIVNRVEIVDPTAVWIVDPTETPTATLFACHPPGSTRERIVVFADLAGPAT